MSNELPQSPEAPINYAEYIEACEFGEYKKGAQDIATFLDKSEMKVVGEKGYSLKSKAEARKKVFDIFCTLCVKAGVAVPDLEPELYLSFIAEADEKEQEVQNKKNLELENFINSQLEQCNDVDSRTQIQTVIDFIKIFSNNLNGNSYGGVTMKEVVALLNKKMVSAGLNPVRPDYSKIEIKLGLQEKGPEKAKSLLIVDDDFNEVINTYIRVAGWPNVTINYYLHERSFNDKSSKEEKLSKISKGILDCTPDIVLMDQGLDNDFTGSELIKIMKGVEKSNMVKFVANTGGEDNELRAAGAYSNFEKGRRIEGLREVFK